MRRQVRAYKLKEVRKSLCSGSSFEVSRMHPGGFNVYLIVEAEDAKRHASALHRITGKAWSVTPVAGETGHVLVNAQGEVQDALGYVPFSAAQLVKD